MSARSDTLAAMRREYATRGLRRAELAADPFAQFRAWFDTAAAAELPEPNAMTLSTADAAGQVTSRTVLLKHWDAEGFVFFTNYGSLKARQIAENPRVSLLFTWIPQERQIAITGRAEKTSASISDEYFRARPRTSQLGARASAQSCPVESRAVLEAQFAEERARFAEGEVARPEGWGGYRVVPGTIEFWQGSASRLHDRFRYTRAQEPAWKIERLSP